jgi:macrodomain Ter protein organizer (MatP/YcbG family)
VEACSFGEEVTEFCFLSDQNQKILVMKAQSEPEEVLVDGTTVLELEPDILVLGEYLAEKRKMTLSEFVEYLITKEASKGKLTV